MQITDKLLVPSEAAQSRAFTHVHECVDCGLLSRLPTPVIGTNICCSRCGHILRRIYQDSLSHSLAWALSAFFFYLLTVASPMLRIGVYGNYRNGGIDSGPFALDNQGYWLLSAVVLLTTVLLPLIKIIGTIIVLVKVWIEPKKCSAMSLYIFLKHLNPWVMVEVYLLGFLVAYSRLENIANVHLMSAVVGLVGLMVSMVAMDAGHDPQTIWQEMAPRRAVAPTLHPSRMMACDTCGQTSNAAEGDHCPRCDEILHHRKVNSLNRSWALSIAAAILYIPSNIFPIMNITKLGKTQSYTIYGGLMELNHVGLWPLAVLVFVASIAIPVFKLVVLAYLMLQTHFGSQKYLRHRTELYRLLDFIGRWSMVDIFVVSILVALVHFGWLTQITPNSGAVYFAAVVILTLLAVHSFDPRLMWDSAAKTRESHAALSPVPQVYR